MTTIAFRADEATERELDELAAAAGVDRSNAIRKAIHAAAERLHRDQLVAASDAIRNDPAEQAELRRIMAELDQISAW
jgi:predicted transcriptional regulator